VVSRVFFPGRLPDVTGVAELHSTCFGNTPLEAKENTEGYTSRFKTELYYRNDTIVVVFFATLASSNAQLENSGFYLTRKSNAYFVVNDTTIFLPGESDRRASCRTRATHFWDQIKSLKIQNA